MNAPSNVRAMWPVETDPFADMLDALKAWNEAEKARSAALLAEIRADREAFDAAMAALDGAA